MKLIHFHMGYSFVCQHPYIKASISFTTKGRTKTYREDLQGEPRPTGRTKTYRENKDLQGEPRPTGRTKTYRMRGSCRPWSYPLTIHYIRVLFSRVHSRTINYIRVPFITLEYYSSTLYTLLNTLLFMLLEYYSLEYYSLH